MHKVLSTFCVESCGSQRLDLNGFSSWCLQDSSRNDLSASSTVLLKDVLVCRKQLEKNITMRSFVFLCFCGQLFGISGHLLLSERPEDLRLTAHDRDVMVDYACNASCNMSTRRLLETAYSNWVLQI